MDWTKEQREAIEKSGQNLLVAAAAGSGKTAVLVQRIIELVSKKENPIDINRLLVLTFTDAAAREMREKILDAIQNALNQNPSDPHLLRQKLLIHSSGISTIHSFCLQLLKNNIHMTDLPVNFSLISETENKMLLDEILDRILERFYGKMEVDPSISHLVMGYGGIKNDLSLREVVLKLFNFSKSMAYPQKWLNASIREFQNVSKKNTLDGSLWQEILAENTKNTLSEILDIYRDINTKIEDSLDESHPYKAFFVSEEQSFIRIFSHMDLKSFSSVRDALLSFSFDRMPSGKRGADDLILSCQENVKAKRQLVKNIFMDLWELYKIPEAQLIFRIKETYPVLRTLKNIVLILNRSDTKAKRQKNFLDFSDLEHETLKLLSGRDEKSSSLLSSLREKYHEILIDEYQDTNHVQETIFSKISRDNSNIFMVGDLKQSIYAFRNAVPKLFSDKYSSYQNPEEKGYLVKLFKNFRSRREVVDTVNFIFSEIMSPSVGDVCYTKDEYLIKGANYPNLEEDSWFEPEFHFVCQNPDDESKEEKLSGHQLEAMVAAKRIREMIASKNLVFDKSLNAARPIEYRDIVILMRNTKTPAPIFEEVFKNYQIPIYTEVGKSYLTSLEVETILSFLKIIDNPRQDIPLVAVMRCPIWGFSPEELGEIRQSSPTGCFFDAVVSSKNSGNKKAEHFLNSLDSLRRRSEYESTEKLIFSIYHEYGYYTFMGSGENGVERQANLRLLFERAADFEKSGLFGLFNFISYIESIKSMGEDLTPAKTLSETDNVVRIMTIHKSKGLEFPVVILSNTSHAFNMQDLNKNIIWNETSGIGADFVDTKMRIRYPSLPRDIVAFSSGKELLSEEMRLLYVALTRAREKLIVTASFKKTKTAQAPPVYLPCGKVRPSYISQKRCFKDWLLAALFTHPDSHELREYFGFVSAIKVAPSSLKLKTFIYENHEDLFNSLLQKEECQDHAAPNIPMSKDISKALDFVYPFKHLTNIPAKLSVSEAKRMQDENNSHAPVLKELKSEGLKSLGKISGAEKGTIVHFVLQSINPKEINCEDDVIRIVDSLVKNGIITKTQSLQVEPQKIFKFFESPLGSRMKTATRLEREFSFYTKGDASEILGSPNKGEILLQGTMDCFFEDAFGKVVLLDFKTDKINEQNDIKRLSKKYKTQMKYYKKALSEILEISDFECYLYFLDSGEMIEM